MGAASSRSADGGRLEQIGISLQAAALPASPGQLLPIFAGEALPPSGVDVSAPDPLPHRRLGQLQVLGHLADRAVTRPASLGDLGL